MGWQHSPANHAVDHSCGSAQTGYTHVRLRAAGRRTVERIWHRLSHVVGDARRVRVGVAHAVLDGNAPLAFHPLARRGEGAPRQLVAAAARQLLPANDTRTTRFSAPAASVRARAEAAAARNAERCACAALWAQEAPMKQRFGNERAHQMNSSRRCCSFGFSTFLCSSRPAMMFTCLPLTVSTALNEAQRDTCFSRSFSASSRGALTAPAQPSPRRRGASPGGSRCTGPRAGCGVAAGGPDGRQAVPARERGVRADEARNCAGTHRLLRDQRGRAPAAPRASCASRRGDAPAAERRKRMRRKLLLLPVLLLPHLVDQVRRHEVVCSGRQLPGRSAHCDVKW